MHWIDWLVVLIPLVAVIYIGYRTQRYVKGVSDFMAGGRIAGRYLLAVAGAEAVLGLVSVIANFERHYKSGFALEFWGAIAVPVGLLMTVTGFAVYRYRETRAMTMAQFFEIRYSKPFRIFAGFLAFASGLINYALFPAVGGRFLLYYCNLPDTVSVASLTISTFGLIMAIFLAIGVAIVLWGGQLSTMVTDCVQGLFSYLAYAAIVIFVFVTFRFDQLRDVMLARGPGLSFVDPFDTSKLTEFNILFVLIGIVASIYNRISWQGTQGFNCAAASAHEQKMAGVLGVWRGGYSGLMILMLCIAGYAYLNHPDFAGGAALVRDNLTHRIVTESPVTTETLRNQMLVPMAVRQILPVGLNGLFCAMMIFLMISTDASYMHSWGSILVQDVIVPLRKRPFTPARQLLLLRLSVLFVAAFAWTFSFYFGQVTYIYMFFAITGAIYMGGAGAVILGGLYWRKGTTAGAWGAMITGSLMGLCGLLIQKFWGTHLYPWLSMHAPDVLGAFKNALEWLDARLPLVHWEMSSVKFPISGAEMLFLTIVCAVIAYVGLSLLTYRRDFELDRMLHRGRYARELPPGAPPPRQPPRSWMSLVGITPECTRGDRILIWLVFAWSMKSFGIWGVLVIWNLCFHRWPKEWWFLYFKYYMVGLTLVVGAVTTIWFTVGGTRDLVRLFQGLRTLQRNQLDDGRVINHANADDPSPDDVATSRNQRHTLTR